MGGHVQAIEKTHAAGVLLRGKAVAKLSQDVEPDGGRQVRAKLATHAASELAAPGVGGVPEVSYVPIEAVARRALELTVDGAAVAGDEASCAGVTGAMIEKNLDLDSFVK